MKKTSAFYLIPPTKIRFGIRVPYFGADRGASSCPIVFGIDMIAGCVTAAAAAEAAVAAGAGDAKEYVVAAGIFTCC